MSFLRSSQNNEKKVMCYSVLIILLAILGIMIIANNWFQGELNTNYWMDKMPGTTEKITNVALIMTIGFSLITSLVQMFIGIKGLMEVKGTSNGGGYITLSKIWLAFEIIALVIEVIGLFNHSADLVSLCSSLAMVLILYDFSESCKELREGK